MFKRGLCAIYNDLDNFKTLLTEKLALCVNDNFFGFRVLENKQMNSTPDKNSTPILKESDIEKLKMWIESGSEESHSTDFVGNTSLILLGRKQINLQNSREKVAWNGFFERLINLGFIEIYGYTTKQNKPKYRLKEAAYEFIDSL